MAFQSPPRMSESGFKKPVIYVHAKDHGSIDAHIVTKLLEPGLPVCSKLPFEGLTKTDNSYGQPGLLITELAGLFPGRPIIFLRAGLQPPDQLLGELGGLLEGLDQPVAMSVLSNADIRVNPFAGLQAPSFRFSHS